MPSPIGHALGSLIVGAPAKRGWFALAVVGAAPDLDLLWGRHSAETHSVGAAVIAGLLALLLTRNRRLAALVTLVWFTHPVMDALAEDSRAPFGVMLWWPFSHDFVIAPRPIFDAISRQWWSGSAWSHNFAALGRELLILGPLALAAFVIRRRRRDRTLL